ncbi:hypothetical protein [Labedaea rhizosphaerae]|uniref:Uncharacterized protein n=1 Tax=Labedaea rhizosphaerae TaxID=598644 RepID=A0A4R6RUL3_LABRH|nr:hypothetical protein [Labedaea rhizosphaerae]TDP90600.1 hypothetical protein EV186_110141 [Labedaea rhizosphaerae]
MLGLDPIHSPPTSGRDAMMAFLWSALDFSVVVVGVALAVFGLVVLWAYKGPSGGEMAVLIMAPLYLAALLCQFIGAFSGLLLAFLIDKSPARFVAGILGGVFFLTCALTVFVSVRAWRLEKKSDRVIGQDEMIDLIRCRAVSSFSKEPDGTVRFEYAERRDENGRYLYYRPTHADSQGYPAYVAAANDLRHRHGHVIDYHNHADSYDPLAPGPRWVTTDEATALLRAGEIDTFSYGEPPDPRKILKAGTSTGIALIDHGWVRHLVVDRAAEAAMIPIAREAQHRHGKPQFSIDGRYEWQ